ncbi:MAG: DNA polymerase III subunit delta, partial [Anaerolineaceae bacterium]|nr:DNA polymerase III subunit delta [Anaerolineaceae bacterium]
METETTKKPVVYIFYGDDDLTMGRQVKSLYEQLGDPDIADLNTIHLDGRKDGIEKIITAAATMPFLAERRLVIFSNPLTRMEDKKDQDNFVEMLSKLPPTAALVLMIEDHPRTRNINGRWVTVWDVLKDNHWLRKWADKAGERAYLKAYPLPKQGAMPGWIKIQAQEIGGSFSDDAAQKLASLVENNTRVAMQEINKLLTYANFERAVTAEDVQQLTDFSAQANIFNLVDSVAQGSIQKALGLLHNLLEQHDAFNLFIIIVRQFRLMLQAREILDEGGDVQKIQ